jgi:carboxylesterase type B
MMGSVHDEGGIFVRAFGASAQQSTDLDSGFRCGIANAARARVLNNVPVWRFHFAMTGAKSPNGIWHGQDIELVFGDGRNPMNRLVQTAWADFAKDPVNGLAKHKFPRYDPKGELRGAASWNPLKFSRKNAHSIRI